MKNLLTAGALALALCACAQIDEGISFLNQPSTQTAIGTLKTLSSALVCDISGAASVASTVATQVKAKAAVQGDLNLVAVGSGTVCAALGGTLTGATVSNAVAVTK